MILKEVIKRLIKELEESSTTKLVPVHQPSEKSRNDSIENEEPTTRERMSKDFT